MKKNILIIGLVGALGISSGLISCAPDYETEFHVSTLVVPDKSQAPIMFSLDGGESVIEVQTNVPFDNWQAASNAEWCKIVRQENKVLVSASENSIYKQRQAEITISYGHQSYSIKAFQFGLEPSILVGEDMVGDGYVKEVDAVLKTVVIPVATNMDLDNIIVPDTCNWVHFVEQPKASKNTRTDNIVKRDLTFTLDQNTDTLVRYCTVILQSSQNYNYTTSFIIKQRERGYIVEIEDAKKEYPMTAMGGIITIPFKVNGPEKAYTYEIEESAKSWIIPVTATRAMRDAYESFTIQPNIIEQVQVGHITFRSTDPNTPSDFTVTITQEAFIPVPPFSVKNATATPGAGFIRLGWEMPEITNFAKMKITYYDKVVQEDKVIEINNNTTTSFIIEDTYECAGEYDFTITTYGPTGMATENPAVVTGTSNAAGKSRVPLTADMLSANATQNGDGEGLPGLVDDNIVTFYHTMYSATAPGKKAHYLQINLKEYPSRILRFEYDARNNTLNNGGDVKRAGIWGSDTDTDGSWIKIGTETFNLPTTKGGHSEPTSDVQGERSYKYIRFIPEARRNLDPLNSAVADQAWWNMSNIYLYIITTHDEAWAKKELGI